MTILKNEEQFLRAIKGDKSALILVCNDNMKSSVAEIMKKIVSSVELEKSHYIDFYFIDINLINENILNELDAKTTPFIIMSKLGEKPKVLIGGITKFKLDMAIKNFFGKPK